jgi:hypothetical protein
VYIVFWAVGETLLRVGRVHPKNHTLSYVCCKEYGAFAPVWVSFLFGDDTSLVPSKIFISI